MGLGQAEALSEASPSMRRRGSSTISQSAWGLRALSPPTRPTCRPRSSWASTGQCARATAGRRTRSTARSTAACSVLMRLQSRRAKQLGLHPLRSPYTLLHPVHPLTPSHAPSYPHTSPHTLLQPLTHSLASPYIGAREEARPAAARHARRGQPLRRDPGGRCDPNPNPNPNPNTAVMPQRLQHAAGAAAHSGDIRMQVSVPGRAMHAIPFWDELRTWDPGD